MKSPPTSSPMNSFRIIEFGDGKLNPLGSRTRQYLFTELTRAQNDPSVVGIVLIGKGNANFSAGADLTEFGDFDDTVTNKTTPSLVEVVNAVERSSKPVVAAIQGVALGGGLELALSCHHRVCLAHEKGNTLSSPVMGLPEVTVGVIPGAGGTQRLPRLVGVKAALEIILTGKPVTSVERAKDLGLVDAVVVKKRSDDNHDDESLLLDCARKWAAWAALMPSLDDRRLSTLPVKESAPVVQQMCDFARTKLPPRNRGGVSVHCALDAIQACKSSRGMQVESEKFVHALKHGHGQRHAFFAARAAQKMSSTNSAAKHNVLQSSANHIQQQRHVGVIGAGTMGSGIALVLLQAGFVVHLVDIQKKALDKGVGGIHSIVTGMVQKKKLQQSKAQGLLRQLVPSQQLSDLRNCVLVVEAVVEKMTVKKQIFSTLNQVVLSPTALLLSNTSTLDIAQIATALAPNRRAYCAGWHFFSPAHMMKLVEIVVAKETSKETVATLQVLTKRIRKVGVVVGNCDGFVGNRMLQPYTSECVFLLSEGSSTVERVDKALYEFGMAMGPFSMSDLAGNDIGFFIRKERGYVRDKNSSNSGSKRKPGMRYTELADDLVSELGRVGQKALKGWYDYDKTVGKGRKPLPSPEVSNFIQHYVPPNNRNMPQLSSQDIVERVLFPLVNEGFKILEEGIASRPSDIDVIYLYGYGWPSWRGGPMFWADKEVGLDYLLKSLQSFYREYPGSDYFKPSRLLSTCVSMGVTVEQFYKRGLHRTLSKL